jgi:hypothetical protein
MTHKALSIFLPGLVLLFMGLMLPGQARGQQPIKVVYPDISTQWVAGNDYTMRWHRVLVKARGSMGDKKYKARTTGR